MINERNALVMLIGEVPSGVNDPHHTKAFYKTIQSFADSSLEQCEKGNLKKFERFLNVALKLFKEGNETVKNGIVNVYLFTVTHALDKKAQLLVCATSLSKRTDFGVSPPSLCQRGVKEM